MLTAEELKQEGNKAFANKEYKKAAKIYRDAIQLDMYNPVLYSNRAQCFINLQDYQRAYRDTTTGINLGAPVPLLVKLYFRNGIASKGLDRLQKAKESFEMVLKLEPTNSAAKLELQKLDKVTPNPPQDEDSLANIPIEDVKELPQEFAKLLVPKPEPEELIEQPKKIETPNIDKDIDELFGKKSKPKPRSKVTPVKPQEISPMHYLTTLKFLPEDQKAKGYKFVLGLDSDSYENIFGSSGIETEFLQFFLDAAVYFSTHENEFPGLNSTVLQHLQRFAKLKKYNLAMLMCDDNTKTKLIELIKQKHPNNLQEYLTYIK